MKMFLLMIFVLPAFALSPSGNKREFCHDRKDPHFVKELARIESNLMSFKNQGGISNGGVCWWHSRFQRNALYLTYFSPEAPRPTLQEARKIISDIRNYRGVVEIKGFENFNQFSKEYMTEIQAELEKWQLYEGRRLTFIRGLRGSSGVSSNWLQELVEDLYEEVEIKKQISYQKLQMNGIDSHAWLVISMKKDHLGYDLEVLDSNYPYRTSFYRYNFGDTSLLYEDEKRFVPYLERSEELASINSSIQEFCGNGFVPD